MSSARNSTAGRATASQHPADRDSAGRLRPGRKFLGRGIFAVAITSSLVFGALYWVTAPSDAWLGLLVAHLAMWVLVGVLVAAYLRAGIDVSGEGLKVYGCFHRMRWIPRNEIESIRTIDVFRSVTMDSLPHLYVCGVNGKVLLRMRGEFWSRTEMERLGAALGAPGTSVTDAVTLAELRSRYPELVPWWQRTPRQLLRPRAGG